MVKLIILPQHRIAGNVSSPVTGSFIFDINDPTASTISFVNLMTTEILRMG